MRTPAAKLSITLLLCVSVVLLLYVSADSEVASPASADRGRITIVDDIGRTVELPHPVRRIVLFQRPVAELVRAVGGEDTIIGLTQSGARGGPEYWPHFNFDNIVGGQQRDPDYERIIELQPDVVIGEGLGDWQENVRKLEPFGIPFAVIEGGWDQRKYVNSIELLGKMLAKPEGAQRVLDFHNEMKLLLEKRVGHLAQRKTIYYEAHTQKAAFITAIPGSGWHDMMVSGGGSNLFGDLDFADYHGQGSVHGVTVDPEAILLRNPDAILKVEPGANPESFHPPSLGEMKDTFDWVVTRPGWERLSALKNDRVLVISNFALNISGKMLGSVYVAKWLYPELFEDVDPDALMRKWLEEFQGIKYPGSYHYPEMARRQ